MSSFITEEEKSGMLQVLCKYRDASNTEFSHDIYSCPLMLRGAHCQYIEMHLQQKLYSVNTTLSRQVY